MEKIKNRLEYFARLPLYIHEVCFPFIYLFLPNISVFLVSAPYLPQLQHLTPLVGAGK